jgi:hypothetical protein
MKRTGSFMATFSCSIAICLVVPALVGQQAGISEVSPMQGTVGTEVSLSGSGFGAKLGKVLLGAEKSKVVSWTDTAITFVVDAPQSSGHYQIRVLPQGDKRPAEPMEFEAFTVRRPMIAPAQTAAELDWDGSAVTIRGEFFGDKAGVVSLAYVDTSVEFKRAKVVEWSTDAVRFELPPGLAGRFLLVVRNGVGADAKVITLSPGEPPVLGAAGYDIGEKHANSSGIFYNGRFYVFSLYQPRNIFETSHVLYQTLADGQFSAYTELPKTIHPDVAVAPVVFASRLWVFATAGDGSLHYISFDGTNWDADWYKIPGVSTGHLKDIAPVFNPRTSRIEVYFENSGHIKWVYSDVGSTLSWVERGQVSGMDPVETPPGAAFYDAGSTGYSTLVAVGDSGSHQGIVYSIDDGTVQSKTTGFEQFFGRPALLDVGPDFLALACYQDSGEGHDGNEGMTAPLVSYYDKATRQWSAPEAPVYPDFSYWPPSLALNYERNTTTGGTDRVLYLFWGYSTWYCCGQGPAPARPARLGIVGSCTSWCGTDPVSMVTPIKDLGQ